MFNVAVCLSISCQDLYTRPMSLCLPSTSVRQLLCGLQTCSFALYIAIKLPSLRNIYCCSHPGDSLFCLLVFHSWMRISYSEQQNLARTLCNEPVIICDCASLTGVGWWCSYRIIWWYCTSTVQFLLNSERAYSSLCYKHHTTIGTHVPYGITRQRWIPAFTPTN